jgi:hypothetical protein
MSIKTMSRVWDQSQHSGSNLLILLAIADFSDDDGQAYPAVSKLAAKCRMSKRNAQDRLRELSESGELTILKNQGPPPKYPNLFRINFGALGVKPAAPVKPTAPVQFDVSRGEAGCAAGVKPTAPKPSYNRQEPSEGAQDKPATPSGRKVTFATWCEAERAAGRSLIADWQPLQRYMQATALTDDLVMLAWQKFKDRYTHDPNNSGKRYIDWRAVFMNALQGNWYKLWHVRDGVYELTTVGQQAQREQAAESEAQPC